jgi:hypothetical protein
MMGTPNRAFAHLAQLSVIAGSEATKQSIVSASGAMDCFASLAMTFLATRRSYSEDCLVGASGAKLLGITQGGCLP